MSFLYGPLDAEYAPKERKKTERRKKQDVVESENEEEEQPEDCDQTGKKKEKDGNELSAVEQHITTIRKTLSDRASEEKESAKERVSEYQSQLSQEIDDETELLKKKKRFIKTNSQVNAVNCLFNPNSFTQTVENVFHFSFLVKESLAGIRSRSVEEAKEFGGTPGPQIRPTREEVDMSPPRQAIVALNMKVRNKPKPDAKQAIVKLDMKVNPSGIISCFYLSLSNYVFKHLIHLAFAPCRIGRICVPRTMWRKVMCPIVWMENVPRRRRREKRENPTNNDWIIGMGMDNQ